MWWIILLLVCVLVIACFWLFVRGSDIRSFNSDVQKVDDEEQEMALSQIKKAEPDN